MGWDGIVLAFSMSTPDSASPSEADVKMSIKAKHPSLLILPIK